MFDTQARPNPIFDLEVGQRLQAENVLDSSIKEATVVELFPEPTTLCPFTGATIEFENGDRKFVVADDCILELESGPPHLTYFATC